jgi:hypothetical protein
MFSSGCQFLFHEYILPLFCPLGIHILEQKGRLQDLPGCPGTGGSVAGYPGGYAAVPPDKYLHLNMLTAYNKAARSKDERPENLTGSEVRHERK